MQINNGPITFPRCEVNADPSTVVDWADGSLVSPLVNSKGVLYTSIIGSISVSFPPSIAVTGPLTDAQLRASPVTITGTVAISGAVSVTGSSVSISGTVAVTGPLTDAQLRASAVPVSGPLTDAQLRASAVPVSISASVPVTGPLTDVQLRATPVPVSGTVAVSGSVAVTGPLTDTQLRASPVVTNSRTFDQSGNGIDSILAGTVRSLLIARGPTNYVLSTNNSTVAQLAAGATFTGTIEDSFNEPSCSILLNCDQPGILTVNQYIVNSVGTQVISTQFVTTANTAGNCFGRSFEINANFINFTFQNTGNAATTTLNLNIAFGDIRPTTQLLNEPAALNEINGTVVASGVGNSTAGTQRVVLASDQPAFTNANLSKELGGQLQSVAELLQLILVELRTANTMTLSRDRTNGSDLDLDLLRNQASLQ